MTKFNSKLAYFGENGKVSESECHKSCLVTHKYPSAQLFLT